jgi:muramoyltetrapeptide carboxypeptidase LdcA involved in peptidoglycan recycling
MRYPKFLPENGTIGFVAPSFGCNTEPYHTAFDNAQINFRRMGHTLDLGPNCYEGRGIGISNTPQACGKELTEYYCSADNDVLISCGGGEMMCETMEHVDFDRLKAAEPKWYMGFSDNTNMTFLLNTICDTAAIYGPCAATFGMEPWHESIQDAYDLLRGKKLTVHGYELWEKEGIRDEEHPLEPYQVTEKRVLRVFTPEGNQRLKEQRGDSAQEQQCDGLAECQQINIEGRLIGGCIDILVNLLGTRFDHATEFTERYKEDGIIWFLEACDLNPMSIRRAIWQMKNAGWFSYVKGFLIGRPWVFGQEMMGLDQYHAVTDLLSEYQVPIIMDVDIGHRPPMMPLISGSYANVNVKENDISIEMHLK